MSGDPIFELLARQAEARAALKAAETNDTLSDDAVGNLCTAECIATYAALATRPKTLAGLSAFAQFGLTLYQQVQQDSEGIDGLEDWAVGRAARTSDSRSAGEIFLTTLSEAARELLGATP
jgi:hypothetical protein